MLSHLSGPRCTKVCLPLCSFQCGCHLLSEAFSHLSSQEGALVWHDISTFPKICHLACGSMQTSTNW